MNSMQQLKRNKQFTLRIFLLSNTAITSTVLCFPEFTATSDTAIPQIQKINEQQLFDSIYIFTNIKQLKEITITFRTPRRIRTTFWCTDNKWLFTETG